MRWLLKQRHEQEPLPTPSPTIVFAVTASITAESFLRGQLSDLVSTGTQVYLCCSSSKNTRAFADQEGVGYFPIPMSRDLLRLRDISAVLKAVRWLKRVRPQIVHYSTPKAALVFALASSLAGVPTRIYLLRGLRLEGETVGSLRYRLLTAVEKFICAKSDIVICVSERLRQEALVLGLAPAHRLRVLAHGSSNGVDTSRFSPATPASRRAARELWGIRNDELVIGFVGRLVQDKGIEDLIAAFDRLPESNLLQRRRLVLFAAGETQSLPPCHRLLTPRPSARTRYVLPGHVKENQTLFHAMDILVHPSHREGMANALLEAAASGVATITTDGPGCSDAVVPGLTGEVVPMGAATELADSIAKLLGDNGLRRDMGAAGRAWACATFGQGTLWKAYQDLYQSLLDERVADTRSRV